MTRLIEGETDEPTVERSYDEQDASTIETKETRCELFGFSPQWMQILASKKVFLLVYGLLGMNQAAIGSYYVATITTFEKRFKLPSTYSGIITSTWDVGGLLTTMFIAFYGSAGNKAKWVGYWSILASVSCIIRILPHFIYGPGEGTYSAGTSKSLLNDEHSLNASNKVFLCSSALTIEENCSLSEEGVVAFVISMLTQLLLGIGTTSYYTLGAAYLDDNVTKNKFPFLFAIAACLRYIGPTFGYIVASYTLGIYINPDITPDFGEDDSRWIGSWHLGWIPFGIIELVMALAMAFFPKILPREAIRRRNATNKLKTNERTFKEFVKSLKRLLKNRILMFNTFSSTFYIFGLMGYWIFMPKYIETQFRKTASEASIVTGSVGLVCTAIGILASGAIVSKLKPRPRILALWNVFTESADVIGVLMFAFIGCQIDDLHGSPDINGKWLLNQTCNAQCSCSPLIPYSPVCSEDGSQMYFSPCHAGCNSSTYVNNTKIYSNCSCVSGSGNAVDGLCSLDCDQDFLIFLIILSTLRFLSSTGRAGNIIIQYRSVAPEDKSVSIAFGEIAVCVLTFIPSPVLFGMIVDSTCQVWGYTCGNRGNCLLYSGKDLRYLLNFTSAGFLFIGLLLDIGVVLNVGSLQMYDEDDGKEKETEQNSHPLEEINGETTELMSPDK